jgi:hypothetical protein
MKLLGPFEPSPCSEKEDKTEYKTSMLDKRKAKLLGIEGDPNFLATKAWLLLGWLVWTGRKSTTCYLGL